MVSFELSKKRELIDSQLRYTSKYPITKADKIVIHETKTTVPINKEHADSILSIVELNHTNAGLPGIGFHLALWETYSFQLRSLDTNGGCPIGGVSSGIHIAVIGNFDGYRPQSAVMGSIIKWARDEKLPVVKCSCVGSWWESIIGEMTSKL
jgi:hypothetical protein